MRKIVPGPGRFEPYRPWPAERKAAAKAARAYRDETFPERPCDHCGKPYRGPAVYCSLRCALADA